MSGAWFDRQFGWRDTVLKIKSPDAMSNDEWVAAMSFYFLWNDSDQAQGESAIRKAIQGDKEMLTICGNRVRMVEAKAAVEDWLRPYLASQSPAGDDAHRSGCTAPQGVEELRKSPLTQKEKL